MFDLDEINPCEDCEEDPDTCGYNPTDCAADWIEEYFAGRREAYD